MWNIKYRNEYNETETDTDTAVTSGKRERRKGKVVSRELRGTNYCVCKGTLNSTRNIASLIL